MMTERPPLPPALDLLRGQPTSFFTEPSPLAVEGIPPPPRAQSTPNQQLQTSVSYDSSTFSRLQQLQPNDSFCFQLQPFPSDISSAARPPPFHPPLGTSHYAQPANAQTAAAYSGKRHTDDGGAPSTNLPSPSAIPAHMRNHHHLGAFSPRRGSSPGEHLDFSLAPRPLPPPPTHGMVHNRLTRTAYDAATSHHPPANTPFSSAAAHPSTSRPNSGGGSYLPPQAPFSPPLSSMGTASPPLSTMGSGVPPYRVPSYNDLPAGAPRSRRPSYTELPRPSYAGMPQPSASASRRGSYTGQGSGTATPRAVPYSTAGTPRMSYAGQGAVGVDLVKRSSETGATVPCEGLVMVKPKTGIEKGLDTAPWIARLRLLGRLLLGLTFANLLWQEMQEWRDQRPWLTAAGEMFRRHPDHYFWVQAGHLPAWTTLICIPATLAMLLGVATPLAATVLAARLLAQSLELWVDILGVFEHQSQNLLPAKELAVVGALAVFVSHTYNFPAWLSRAASSCSRGVQSSGLLYARARAAPGRTMLWLTGKLLVAPLFASIFALQYFLINRGGTLDVAGWLDRFTQQHYWWPLGDGGINNWLPLQAALYFTFASGISCKRAPAVLAALLILEAVTCWRWWSPMFEARSFVLYMRRHFAANMAVAGGLLLGLPQGTDRDAQASLLQEVQRKRR